MGGVRGILGLGGEGSGEDWPTEGDLLKKITRVGGNIFSLFLYGHCG